MKKRLSAQKFIFFGLFTFISLFLMALLPFYRSMAAEVDKTGTESMPLESSKNDLRDELKPIDGFISQQAGAEEQEGKTTDSISAEDSAETVEQAVYPGVINRIFEAEINGSSSIKLYYPVFGNSDVDAAIKEWVNGREKYFESLLPDKTEEAGEGEEAELAANFEMSGFYTLEHPIADVVSVLFNIYAYTGGAHGNLWLDALNYNLKTGKQLLFKDLFANPDEAVRVLSRISIEKLAKSLGEDTDEAWLERGAGPEGDNFTVLSLLPEGLFVEFQPYQVGPWSAGPQRVFVSLKELRDAKPSSEVWNLPLSEPDQPQNSHTEEETDEDLKKE